MRPLPLLLTAAPLAVTLVACGTASAPTAPVVTVTAPAPSATKPPKTPKGENADAATPAAKKMRLPNVVGMKLQAGQDKLQASGFYALNDKDATGRGRFQVFDRNWVVTRMTPAAGSKVSADTLITLYAKKYGE